MKPEFSSSDLVLALAIVNGTAAPGVRGGLAEAGDAGTVKAGGDEQVGHAAAAAPVSQ